MNLAKVSDDWKITIPYALRSALQLKQGDKLLFIQHEDGSFEVENAAVTALKRAQEAFAGVAEELGNPSEEEVQTWVDEVRYGKGTQA
ncbi:MAG: AbrB/MazE/SpoVT family DNA-binding domain-containing protein [Oscillospiraceae bacterium]|jgi:bifunctional DNA-binding transcriptional regulator/antitoxin component of YhaV-PrlF toxin-antitoxin module|nr:AbrB/MazE/SpoVT family DNA-binding domain-containing protein [Oscillospiraceae bacterium]